MTTLFIGDVHGCSRELAELLDQVGPGQDDRVVIVGDLVARGPDSSGVLRLVREVRGLAVRGNHEERLLSSRFARRKGETGPRLGPSHAALMETLTEEEWAQLESLPLKLDFEDHGVRVVHAGVVPGLPWENQDPRLITHIRSINDDGTPSEKHGPLWGSRYEGPLHVVFGHNARREVQLHPYATGLDTACVYGGRLTGLVLPAGSPVPPLDSRRDALVQVPAHAVYSDYGRPLPAD
jgi:hypothetical protein